MDAANAMCVYCSLAGWVYAGAPMGAPVHGSALTPTLPLILHIVRDCCEMFLILNGDALMNVSMGICVS